MLSTDVLDGIKRRGLEIAKQIEAKCGPYRAEIVPGCVPSWHLVRAAPSFEARAAKRLIDRGFGVYLPMIRSWRHTRGRQVRSAQLFFPGYVFVFVWDVHHHWRRIKSCTGVQGIVCREDRPVIVPDAVIDKLQGLEFREDETWVWWETEQRQVSKKKKKRDRRKAKHHTPQPVLTREEMENPVVTISTRSYWDEFRAVDSETRLSALHTALGLLERPPGASLADCSG